MLKQKSMLGFFLEQQQKITHFQMNDCSLLEKKNLAENYYLRNKSKLNFELKLEQKFETHFLINQNKVNSLFVPHYILDPDFCKLYHTKYQEHNAIQKEDFYCLFTSPLHENWMDTISIINITFLTFRTIIRTYITIQIIISCLINTCFFHTFI